jgi:hypothetical protein
MNGQGCVVSPDVAHQGVEDGSELRADLGDVKHVLGIGLETRFTLVGNHDRCRLVRFENGRVLDDIANDRSLGTGGTDDDQRLGRKVDVFFVLDIVG